MDSKKLDSFIDVIKNHFGWNDPFIIEYIDNLHESIVPVTFDTYIKQEMSNGFNIECI